MNLAELLISKYQNDEKYRDRIWTTILPDTVELYPSFSEEPAVRELTESGEFRGLGSGQITKSVHNLQGRTLKKKAAIGKVNVSLSDEGYYDLFVDMLEDKEVPQVAAYLDQTGFRNLKTMVHMIKRRDISCAIGDTEYFINMICENNFCLKWIVIKAAIG